jgi:DNA-binding NarL/FixJ family response regulator
MTDVGATAALAVGGGSLEQTVSELLESAGVALVAPGSLREGHVMVSTLDDGRPPALEDLGATTGARLVVLSDEAGDYAPAVRRCLRMGVAGFVERDRLAVTLVPTVLAVAAGQSAVPLGGAQDVVAPNLTTREKQVLGLVVMGLSNGEIASRLYVAESTVKSHLTTAFSKLGVRSRNHAVALILDPQSGLGTGILGIPRT